MSKSMKRSLKTAQVGMRQLNVRVSAAGAFSGFDGKQISSDSVKNGAGDHTIVLKKPFNVDNANLPMIKVTPLAAGVTYYLASSAHDRVNVVLSADVDFDIEIIGCDHRFNY